MGLRPCEEAEMAVKGVEVASGVSKYSPTDSIVKISPVHPLHIACSVVGGSPLQLGALGKGSITWRFFACA